MFAALVHQVFAQRVVFHDGDVTLAPGLSLHLLGGHTAGTQVVQVRTAGGWVVLASDASHYYENMEAGRPLTSSTTSATCSTATTAWLRWPPSGPPWSPGHDPLVLERYPAAGPGLEGIADHLDEGPLGD